jgi:hypothetical protein
MQADITEDNAGNGPGPGDDPNDAGWNWALPDFFHNGTSYSNLTGVIANSVFEVYELTGDAALFTTLSDVADHIMATGPGAYPTAFSYPGDIMFLLRWSQLPHVVDPVPYQNMAAALWSYRLAGSPLGTATSVAEKIRDARAGSYQNGIIAWDIGVYCQALMMLDAALPGNGYAADAAAMAEVLWQDSFALNPGYFDFDGRCKGYDPTYTNKDYWWYALGISGLIQAFETTGTHLGDIPLLQTRMLECQYPDGAFGDQYGTPTDVNTRDWQTTAYAVQALTQFLPQTAATGAATYAAGTWLGATQDVSGGFVYSDGYHYPEIGAEAARALAFAFETAGASLVATVDGPDPVPCGETKTVTVNYEREIGTPGLRGYEITFEVTGAAVSFDETNVASGGALPAVGGTYFQAVPLGGGVYTVNEAILGATPGLLADGALFTVALSTVGDGPVTFDILSYKLRDPDNGFMFADFSGTAFTVDCTAPDPVTDITAGTRHNKIDVAWNHDGDDTAEYVIYRGLWYDTTVGNSAYPEYDDLAGSTIPTRPVDYADAKASAEWDSVAAVGVGTTTFTDVWPDHLSRGVYYYEVFAVDAATNTSPIAAANDRATNYWLGDLDQSPGDVDVPDGNVDSFDINKLGAAFATAHGDALYNNEVDVGPTDDWSRLGIPTTDSIIDFEDLMVFSMNFNVVTPAKIGPALGGQVDLAWRDLGDGRWALELLGGGGLKGLHVTADLPVGAVRPGTLLQGREVFLVNPGGRLDANLALLGRGQAIEGAGELLVITTAVDPRAADIDARGVGNVKLAVDTTSSGGGETPLAFRLVGNHPNPFNPMTKIAFTLPADGAVKLSIYSLDGRRIATLVDEPRTAGEHEVIWDGRDDAGRAVSSGSYLYRLEAGPMSQVKKMTLMK